MPKKKSSLPNVHYDIEKIKDIARCILTRLEEALKQNIPATAAEAHDQQKYHDRLFGNKNSLVSTLVALAELMLRLEELPKSSISPQEISEPAHAPLNKSDVALVEIFLRRIQTENKVSSQP